LLRFEYVTDQGYNAQGFALRNVRVPQIGLAEPGAVEGSWFADGWVRVDAPVPQRWELRLVRWTADGSIQVVPVAVSSDGQASFELDASAARSVLVVAPSAPRTLQRAAYTVSIGG
jgi:hypothetical protein